MLSLFATLLSVSPTALVPPSTTEALQEENIPAQESALTSHDQGQVLTSQITTQAKSKTPSQSFYQIPSDIRALPGELDETPVFNSNNPEIVRQSGILLSTFPDQEMKFPDAHLDYTFKGRFDLFSHHIAKSDYPDYTPTLYLGVLIKNASSKKKNVVDILQAASYLGTPDAPYISLPPISANDVGRVYSGPGDRVSDVILRGIRQSQWKPRIELNPDESVMLMNLPVPLPSAGKKIPLGGTVGNRVVKSSLERYRKRPRKSPSSNARSTLVRLKSKKDIYIASMAMFAPIDSKGKERIPTLSDWQGLLKNGRLIQPRDRPPSPLNSKAEKFFYGRVAGVSQGSEWTTQITDGKKKNRLTIPKSGQSISFGISTLQRGTFGTEQIQSAPMIVRYPDTAYLAHGNYGVHYNLTLPLYNDTKESKTVNLSFQTPIKANNKTNSLNFYQKPPSSIFFRGTVRLRYRDDKGSSRVRYFHIVHRRGELSSPLIQVTLEPKQSRLISLDFIYPPDATPPQVLKINTK